MRRTTTIALSAAALVGLAACGGAEPLTQEQTTEALLTEEDFPLDGFTAGEVTEGSTGTDGGAEDVLEGFPGADQLEQECQDALTAMGEADPDYEAQSSISFTGSEGDSPMGPSTIEVGIASAEGEDPLGLIDDVTSSCDEVTIEQDGFTMTMNFEEIDGDAQGAKITLDVMGESVALILGGRQDGDNFVWVNGQGVEDADVITVLDAQEEKINDL